MVVVAPVAAGPGFALPGSVRAGCGRSPDCYTHGPFAPIFSLNCARLHP